MAVSDRDQRARKTLDELALEGAEAPARPSEGAERRLLRYDVVSTCRLCRSGCVGRRPGWPTPTPLCDRRCSAAMSFRSSACLINRKAQFTQRRNSDE